MYNNDQSRHHHGHSARQSYPASEVPSMQNYGDYQYQYASAASNSRGTMRRPSQGNITYPVAISQREAEGVMPLLNVLMPGGRTAPINPDSKPPTAKYSAPIEAAIRAVANIKVEHYVVARKWSRSRQCYKDWAEGQVEGFYYDEEDVPMLTISHVDQHTQKGYNEVYWIRKGDQVEEYRGDVAAISKRLEARPDTVAPTMGASRSGPSKAVSSATAFRQFRA